MAPLLLIHGFTGAPSSFDGVLSRLPAPRTTIAAPFVTGHGAPPAALESDRFEAEVDRLAALIPAGERAVVVGYSLGARLAFGVLVRHAHRVRSLIAISGSAGLASEAERTERRSRDHALARKLESEGLEAFVRFWEDQPLFASQRALDPALVAAERSRRLAHTAAGLAHSLRTTGLAEMPDHAPALARVDRPVELLAGGLDARFCTVGRALERTLPRAHLTVVPDAGHNLLLERPEAVAAAITRGLA